MKGGRPPYEGLQGEHFYSEKQVQRPRGGNHLGQLMNGEGVAGAEKERGRTEKDNARIGRVRSCWEAIGEF